MAEDMDGHMAQAAARTKGIVVRGLRRGSNFLWPKRSLLSDARSVGGGPMPIDDWQQLTFLLPPHCERCGTPMEALAGSDEPCAACRVSPPPWHRARAALAYNDGSRQLVLGLKRGARRDGLKLMAGWMAMAGRDVLEDADMIVPVPLHYRRLVQRGFNQAGWMAQAVGRAAKVPVKVAALKRHRATPSQGGLDADARRANVAGAFSVRRRYRERVAGARIVLVDDVLTTGATLGGCTAALADAGAGAVDVLVLTRVVRGGDVPI